ncbi:zinc ABC transporter substrate-binding protein [Pseudooceanicola algae]|uniref:High-affinity zinc uptake system protein ZnuA n=1 Tax=Pseudooceanicola algae TaxID=1537215 RepID=A0A418SBL3_9RHOB|nr:zinc ABC transporter substrate-binding protein [Pseudooceanicola algae]QPM92480.1 High-affinity zinc uptake system protein ZnuA [Pseudooceanicola algae]
MSRNLASLSFAASLLAGTALADVPNVAVDISPVHSMVARVMEGVGEPSLIVATGASPHEYNLRPSEANALQNADLVFWVGPDLTPWLDDAIATLAEDATVVELIEAEGTTELPMRESALFEPHDHGHEDHDAEHGHDDHDGHGEDHAEDHDGNHGHDDDHGHADEHDHEDAHGHDDEHDHEEHDDHAGHDGHDHGGHDHGGHDPHAWLSPDNAEVWLNAIAAALSAQDPDNAGAYYANAAAGRAELVDLRTEIEGTLDQVRGENFIVFHDAYQYFEMAFDFPASGAISVSDASDPSPARIAEIQTRIAEQNVTCIMSEPQFNPGIVASVMDGSEAHTGVMDPLGADLEPGADLYPQLLRNLATSLAECL